MTYGDGSWGEKAKARYQRRKREGYFKKYDDKRRHGSKIPKDIRKLLKVEKCQMCGIKNSKKRFKGLVVHHIDHNDQHNVLNNLMVVCRGCHNRIHKTKTPTSQEG